MKIKNEGFSLVELMVAVGIISILATVVMPVYSSYSFRARTVEAKATLASFYTSQKSFHVQFGRYHSSFRAIGFEPEGFVHFNIGFGAPGIVAGPAQGFDLVVDPTIINSQSFCGGIGGANVAGNNCTLVNPTPTLNAALMPDNNDFTAGATINRSLYGVQLDPHLLPASSSPASLIARVLAPMPAYAIRLDPAGVRSLQFLNTLPAGHEVWLINGQKELAKFSGP